jgi:hypothetical protein
MIHHQQQQLLLTHLQLRLQLLLPALLSVAARARQLQQRMWKL